MAPATLADALRQPRNNLNLLRLFAAWLVIYGHAYAITGSSGPDLILRVVQLKFAGGVAVDVFFFVSGCLIAASLARHSMRDYLVARALRIYPALVVCVLLTVFVLGPLVSTANDYWRAPETWQYLLINATLWDARHVLPGVFTDHPNAGVNGSLWSLPVEVRLYLVLAAVALLGLLHARKRFNVCYAVVMVGGYALARFTELSPEDSNHAWCTAFFLTGAFCWINRERVPLSWLLLAVLVCIAGVMRGTPHYHIGYFAALCYGVLMIGFVPRLPVIRRRDLSYGLYLYGWPSQQLVQQFAPQTGLVGNIVFGTTLALALAWLSWHIVEAPALRLKQRIAGAPPLAAAGDNAPS